jgi:hypothetical protein
MLQKGIRTSLQRAGRGMNWHCLALKQFYIKNVGPAKIQNVQQKIPGCWTYVQQNENKFQKEITITIF